MALTGSSIASTYLKLLRINTDTMGADATASYIQDSADTDSALSISTTRVGIGAAAPTNNLHIEADSGDEGITIHAAGDTSNAVILDANRAGAGSGLGAFVGKWNGTAVADILFLTGSDTTNKDDGEITFRTSSADNLTEQMRIDSSGSVGIGTDAPDGPLHVHESTCGAVTANTNFNDLVLETSAHTGITIFSGTGSDGGIYFGDSGGNNRGQIKYHHGTPDSMSFSTADSLAMTIDSAGDVTFVGDLIMADGKGIDFSADASPAAGMTAEILDDYEEGTWTPTNNGGTITFTTLSSPYTKIGREVHIQAYLSLSSDGASSAISLGGLPFAAASGGYAPSILNAGQTNGKVVLARVHSSATTLNFYDAVSQGTINEDEIDNAHVIFQITYNV